MYYREAVGAIVVFNISNPHSLEMAKVWKMEIDTKAKLVGRKLKTPIPVVLLGNKVFLLLLFV
jgi:GTPase SAR1 family protein